MKHLCWKMPICATALVAFRIWFINRRTAVFTGSSLRPVIFLVIESGALYSITLLAMLILYVTQSPFQYVLVDAVGRLKMHFHGSFSLTK